jgi:hypothetical protein
MDIVLALSIDELSTLIALARYYEKSLGPIRHVVRFTAPTLRGRYRFMREESRVLQHFAETMRSDLVESGRGEMPVQFTLRALIAFWGRILASLQTKRSRRKLSDEQVREREHLAQRFQVMVERIATEYPEAIQHELATRRPREAQWMKDRLAPIHPEAESADASGSR